MMYKFALFLHITGAVILFACLGIELISLLNLKRESIANQRLGIPDILKMNKVYGITMVLIILSGIHLMSSYWGFSPWIIVSFIGIIINAFLFMNVTSRRLKYYIKSSAEKNENSLSEKHNISQDNVLWSSINIRIAIVLGIILVMTIKPEMLWSIVTLISSILLGLIFIPLNKKSQKSKDIRIVNNI